MNQSANRAFRHLAGNRSIQSTPVSKIETLATGYPFFPVAQFFLAKKLKENSDDNYIKQSQKSVIYFFNPLWFDCLLYAEIHPEEEPTDDLYETMAVTGQHEIFSQHEEPPTETLREAETNKVIENNFLSSEKDTSLSEPNSSEPGESITPVSGKNLNPPLDKELTEEPDEHEKMYRSIKAMLDATSEEADAEIKDSEVPIDPYYTIDYFSSQGIKLDLEINANDKLGQNLKKFTHWLRHMKKLGPEDAKTEIENSESEQDIQKLANSSNNAREVVTEAMASVLERQGKREKAIELYTKLSFLNPDKSAYFAAQIEKLKVF